MKKKIEFVFERETKRTFRFQEAGPDEAHLVGTLYVKQSAFDGKAPEKLTVTVEG